MYKTGELVMYGSVGVCVVEEVGCPEIPSIDRDRTYYTLRTIYGNDKIYTPVDTMVFMRPVITNDEAQELIRRIPEIKPDICTDNNTRVLTEFYNEYLKTHECADLVGLIRSVYMKGKHIVKENKKLGVIDERYMKKAEEILHEELSVALEIPKDEVKNYISIHVTETEEEAFLA